MNQVSRIVAAVAIAAGALGSVQAANVASGKMWHVPEAISLNAIPANVPVTTPDVTFDVNSPFNFNGSGFTVGNWLASSSAFNVVENTAGTLGSLMDNGTQGTLVTFAGLVSVFTGETFTVTHDDGLTLIINGINLGFNPGPTAPTTSIATYTGATGTFAFSLVYGECCGGPAVLQIDLPFTNAVPEPETYALMMAGLGALGFVARRRRRA